MKLPRLLPLNLAFALILSLTAATYGDTLQAAAERGDMAAVKAILAAQPEALIARDQEHGNTALHWSSYRGHLEVVQFLLEQGADVSATTTEGYTPLRDAAYQGHTKVVKALLDAGSSVGLTDNKGATPLHWAAHGGQTAVAKLLLAASADPIANGGQGQTPIQWARQAGRAECARVLEAAAAEQFVKFVRADDTEKAGRLLKRYPPLANLGIYVPGYYATPQERPLSEARSLKMTRLLLEAGADPTLPVSPCGDGTYIMTAMHHADLARLEAMLESGANPDTTWDYGKTPLHAFTWSPGPEHVRLLLKYRANPNLRDDRGNTPLHNIAEETGRVLSRRSADPDDQVLIAGLLLAHGADLDARNDEGLTALQLATRYGHRELAAFLSSR